MAVDNCIAPGQVCIQVHNDGASIPPDVLPSLTEPFYTTKSAGTGLGLAIARRLVVRRIIVKDNQAAIEWYYEDTEKATGLRSKADDAIITDFKDGRISRESVKILTLKHLLANRDD